GRLGAVGDLIGSVRFPVIIHAIGAVSRILAIFFAGSSFSPARVGILRSMRELRNEVRFRTRLIYRSTAAFMAKYMLIIIERFKSRKGRRGLDSLINPRVIRLTGRSQR